MIGGFRSVCFFVAEKHLPMILTSTVVNFLNFHSLLDQFGSLGFEQKESSDWCWFTVKYSFFREIKMEN